MLTVYLADDSIVVRSKLKEALEEQASIKVIGESGETGRAITEIRQLDPQVVIIDIRMPGGGGMPVLKDCKAQAPGCTAIILTSFPYQEYRDAYLAAGADYFFDKTRDIQTLTDLLVKLARQPEVPGSVKNGVQA